MVRRKEKGDWLRVASRRISDFLFFSYQITGGEEDDGKNCVYSDWMKAKLLGGRKKRSVRSGHWREGEGEIGFSWVEFDTPTKKDQLSDSKKKCL